MQFAIYTNSKGEQIPCTILGKEEGKHHAQFENGSSLLIEQEALTICTCEEGHPYNNLCCPVHGICFK